MIEAFEQDPPRDRRHRAQNKAMAKRQFISPEYHVVVVNASYSKGHTYNTAKAYERNHCQ